MSITVKIRGQFPIYLHPTDAVVVVKGAMALFQLQRIQWDLGWVILSIGSIRSDKQVT